MEGVTSTACLVHARRKLAEVVKVAGGGAVREEADSVALEARRRMDRMFRVDSKFGEMDPEARRKAREKKLRPLMESFKTWAETAAARAVPKMPLHGALLHALKYRPYVMNVLKDGRLGLGNDIGERAVEAFAIGGKNWLFSDTARGADASAAVYSVVATAKLDGLNQRAYLEWLPTEMPDDAGLGEPGRIDRCLPWSEGVPAICRLSTERAEEAAEMRDEPIIDLETVEAVLENS